MRASLPRVLSTVGAAVLATAVLAVAPATAAPTDTAHPVLRGVAVNASSVSAGSTLTASLDATDDVGIERVYLRFDSVESLDVVYVQRSWEVGGTVRVAIPQDIATGGYRLDHIVLVDGSDKHATYIAKGSALALSPKPAGAPTTHSVDMGATFSVTGGVDRTPPRITSLTMASRPTYVDETGRMALALDTTEPVQVRASWDQPTGLLGTRGPQESVSGGSASLPVDLSPAGIHSFSEISVSDADGNIRRYYPDGREVWGRTEAVHGLPLEDFDVTVKPSTPSAVAKARPGSVRLLLHADDREAKTMTGWRVVVGPGSLVRDVPVKVGWTQVDIGGLANGTAYTVSTTARSAVGDSRAAVSTIRPMPSSNVFALRDATGDGRVDIIARQPHGTLPSGDSYVYPTNGSGTFGRRVAAFRASESECERVAPADVYPTSEAEVLCYGPSLLAKWPAGHGYLLGTAGWSSMRFVDGGHDVTGDGNPDVVAVTAAGVLKIYETRRATTVVASSTLGSGWNVFTALLQVGDFSGDRRADLLAVDGAGRLWLYAGNGRGGFAKGIQIGSGWGGFGAVMPLRDFNGDGRADIGAITMDGKLLLYPGNGQGGFLAKSQIGTGWNMFL